MRRLVDHSVYHTSSYWRPKMFSFFLWLPLELVLHIFGYAAFRERFKLRIVCRSWNELLIHPVLLKRLDLSNLTGKRLRHGLHVCFNLATNVFSLDLSGCGDVRAFHEKKGMLLQLKRLCVASSHVGTATVIQMLKQTSCLQELDMSHALISDDVCEEISKFASHTLRVLYLPSHLVYPFWSQSRILRLLENCKELTTLGVEGDMVNVELIGKSLKQSKLRKLRLTDVKDSYVIDLARTLHPGHSTRNVELCVCRCCQLRASTMELLNSLSISMCSKCRFDIDTFTWM